MDDRNTKVMRASAAAYTLESIPDIISCRSFLHLQDRTFLLWRLKERIPRFLKCFRSCLEKSVVAWTPSRALISSR